MFSLCFLWFLPLECITDCIYLCSSTCLPLSVETVGTQKDKGLSEYGNYYNYCLNGNAEDQCSICWASKTDVTLDRCREAWWGVKEAGWKHEWRVASQRLLWHNFYLHQPGNSACVGKDTNKIFRKWKQKQRLNNSIYLNNHIVYLYTWWKCDKMINNKLHKMCSWLALKTSISQCRGEYQTQQYQLNNESSQCHRTYQYKTRPVSINQWRQIDHITSI